MKPILLILLATSAIASAETTENLLEQLRTSTSSEAREARKSKDPAGQQRTYQWQELLNQLDRKQNNEQGNAELQRTIHAIEAATGSETLATLCRTLSAQLQAEAEKRDEVLADEMENAFREALRSGLAAKSFKEVDAPLATVSKYSGNSHGESTNVRLRKLAAMEQPLWDFLRRWQDYIAGVSEADSGNSKQSLQNVLNSGAEFATLIPRSEFLEGFNARALAAGKKWTKEEIDQKTRDILKTVHSLDDVAAAIGLLEDLQNNRSGFPSEVANRAIGTLKYVERTRRDLDQGLSTQMSLKNVTQIYATEVDQLLAQVRGQILLYAMPRLLGGGDVEKPKPDESVGSYLQRVTLSARDRGDWVTLERAIGLSQSVNMQTPANVSDLSALQSFLAGLNQERAQQFSFAVMSYEAALRAGSQLLPAETIGEHLERIRKEHPADYTQGVRMALNPGFLTDPPVNKP